MQNRNQGIFIGFIGLPSVGKSTLAEHLAKQIGGSVFIEPSEDQWDFDHHRDWKEQVARIENWVCNSNASKFREAHILAKKGLKAVADAGIFLVNKELIHAPCTQWWYGHINHQEKSKLHALAERNWADESCRPDVLVLIETDKATWLSYMKKRGRSDDNDVECVKQYDVQKKLMSDSAERYARDHGIPLVRFINTPGMVDKNAAELAKTLNIYICPPIQPSTESKEVNRITCRL